MVGDRWGDSACCGLKAGECSEGGVDERGCVVDRIVSGGRCDGSAKGVVVEESEDGAGELEEIDVEVSLDRERGYWRGGVDVVDEFLKLGEEIGECSWTSVEVNDAVGGVVFLFVVVKLDDNVFGIGDCEAVGVEAGGVEIGSCIH